MLCFYVTSVLIFSVHVYLCNFITEIRSRETANLNNTESIYLFIYFYLCALFILNVVCALCTFFLQFRFKCTFLQMLVKGCTRGINNLSYFSKFCQYIYLEIREMPTGTTNRSLILLKLQGDILKQLIVIIHSLTHMTTSCLFMVVEPFLVMFHFSCLSRSSLSTCPYILCLNHSLVCWPVLDFICQPAICHLPVDQKYCLSVEFFVVFLSEVKHHN